MTSPIDLRSDTVTKPSPGMRAAMMAAEVGDDVYREDPTVTRLEQVLSQSAGFEAGLFMPSGTQSNLVALITHCARGEEYLVGQEAHIYRYEGGGVAVLGGIQPQPIENLDDGSIALEKLAAAIKPDDFHCAMTRVIALENTIHGNVLSKPYVESVAALARDHALSMHLDGARAFNAAVATNVSIGDICEPFDSVSICLSKGMGAPVGSVLCGDATFIERARRLRKMLGGGMRQVGMLAAAGLYAIEHNVDRLADDHRNARRLADGLREIVALGVSTPQTNVVYLDIPKSHIAPLQKRLDAAGIRCALGLRTRLVTHLDLDENAIDQTVRTIADYFATC